MGFLTSTPNGFALMGWKRFLISAAFVWAVPGLLGALLLGLQWLAGSTDWGRGFAILWLVSFFLLLSPALSWFGLAISAPFIAVLMDRGWFGWIPALGLGIATGGLIGLLSGNDVLVSVGAAFAVLLRATLARTTPEAFATSSL